MPNAAGKPLTLPELNRVIGSLARDLTNIFNRIRDSKKVIDGFTSADLAALPPGAVSGFVAADGDNVKSFLADAAQLADIFDGAAAIGVAKDFRVFTNRLRGFESVM